MSDWMNTEINVQRQREESEKERRRRESDARGKKWNQMDLAASPKITLLKKMVSEFCKQTGLTSWVDESHKFDNPHWRKSLTIWSYAEASFFIKNRSFKVLILVREPFWFFGPKVWVDFRYTDVYYKYFSTSATEHGLKNGFKQMFKIATKK